MAIPLMAIMAAAQYASAADKEKRQRFQAAQTQRLSPWTGLQAGPIEDANPVGIGMQAYGGHVAMEQNQELADQGKRLSDAQARYYDAMADNPWFKNRRPY